MLQRTRGEREAEADRVGGPDLRDGADPGGDQVEEDDEELGVGEHHVAETWQGGGGEGEEKVGRCAVRDVYGRDGDILVSEETHIYCAKDV